MDCIIFNMAGMHRHGSAFYDFLRLRKTFFVDQLGWDIPHDDDVEMDQYDNPQAWYILVRDEEGEVVGGGRLLPNSARWGTHTYMLKDAADGRLGSIPSNILEGVRMAKRAFEMTRVVVSDALTTQAERSACLSMILGGAEDLLLRFGADEAISLSPPPMVRAMRSLGYDAERRGSPYLCEDGRQYAVLGVPVRAHMKPNAAKAAFANAVAHQATGHLPKPALVHAPQKD